MHRETEIQNKIRVALSEHGVVFRMNSGLLYDRAGNRIRVGAPGMADLLYVGEPYVGYRPTVAWLEIKTAKGQPTDEQLHFIEQMQKLGCKAGIARSVQDAKEIICLRENL